jgi:hypothetical protein
LFALNLLMRITLIPKKEKAALQTQRGMKPNSPKWI